MLESLHGSEEKAGMHILSRVAWDFTQHNSALLLYFTSKYPLLRKLCCAVLCRVLVRILFPFHGMTIVLNWCTQETMPDSCVLSWGDKDYFKQCCSSVTAFICVQVSCCNLIRFTNTSKKNPTIQWWNLWAMTVHEWKISQSSMVTSSSFYCDVI